MPEVVQNMVEKLRALALQKKEVVQPPLKDEARELLQEIWDVLGTNDFNVMKQGAARLYELAVMLEASEEAPNLIDEGQIEGVFTEIVSLAAMAESRPADNANGTSKERRKYALRDLTKTQFWVLRTFLKLLNKLPEDGLLTTEAVFKSLPIPDDVLTTAIDAKSIAVNINGNIEDLMIKMRKVLVRLEETPGEEVTFFLIKDQLDQFLEFPKIYEILYYLCEVEEYKDLTFSQVMALPWNDKIVRLGPDLDQMNVPVPEPEAEIETGDEAGAESGQSPALLESVAAPIEIKNEAPLFVPLTVEEILFLGGQILKFGHQALKEHQEQCIRDEVMILSMGIHDKVPHQLSEKLKEKLRCFFNNAGAERQNYVTSLSKPIRLIFQFGASFWMNEDESALDEEKLVNFCNQISVRVGKPEV